jgi:CheY-like chemotaxis protein
MALVVEDYELNLSTFTMALELQGWNVRQARSLVEAFTKVASGPVHLLLTEIDLTDGDGFQLAQRVRFKPASLLRMIRSSTSATHVRRISWHYSTRRERQSWSSRSARGFCTKPFNE